VAAAAERSDPGARLNYGCNLLDCFALEGIVAMVQAAKSRTPEGPLMDWPELSISILAEEPEHE